jgi:predicted Zn finger-like uncharacterized protein
MAGMVSRNRVIRRIMLVVCPSCSASYRLAAAALGPGGRTVRCAECRTTWFVAPPAEEDALPPAPAARSAEPEPDPELRPAQVARPRPGLHVVGQDAPPAQERPALRARRRPPNFAPSRPRRNLSFRPAGAVVAIGVVLFVGAGVWRKAVVAAFPQAAPLYASVGLPVNLRGLTFKDVTSSETVENGTPILRIAGRIENISGEPQDVPRLRLAVRGNNGREIYVWTAVPAKSRLAAGEDLPFNVQLAAPPAEGREIAVRFLTAGDLTASLGRKTAK